MNEFGSSEADCDSCESEAAIKVLREVGQQLDNNILPVVKNDGLVVPNPKVTDQVNFAMEKANERKGQGRPETGSRTRAERRQRQTRRSWQTYSAPSVVSSHIRQSYLRQLDTVSIAYPSCRVWHQQEGLWLLTESSVLPGRWHKAAFATGLSYVYPFVVRSWGFWVSGISLKPVWIGPRHTNFPDGSICAHEPSDRTWLAGESIITLLDLYTLWALRHRHLEFFGRWPGRQAVDHPYERLQELKGNEFCGCQKSNFLYKDCCRESDLTRDRVADALDFRFKTGQDREPPKIIVDFVINRDKPPEHNRMLSYA